MFPQKDNTVCGQQVNIVKTIVKMILKLIIDCRMFVWSLDDNRVMEQTVITIPVSQSMPMPKLNVQNRCPAKIKLEEFQEEDPIE